MPDLRVRLPSERNDMKLTDLFPNELARGGGEDVA